METQGPASHGLEDLIRHDEHPLAPAHHHAEAGDQVAPRGERTDPQGERHDVVGKPQQTTTSIQPGRNRDPDSE